MTAVWKLGSAAGRFLCGVFAGYETQRGPTLLMLVECIMCGIKPSMGSKDGHLIKLRKSYLKKWVVSHLKPEVFVIINMLMKKHSFHLKFFTNC